MTFEELEQQADYLSGARDRRLFLMDTDGGVYWIRSDMTSEEAELMVDTIANWLLHVQKGVPLGSYTMRRLYDDGDMEPR